MNFYITDGIFHRAATPPEPSAQSIPFKVADDASEITIPDGVVSIWRCALSNRSLLQRVYIPSSVTYIARMAFSACTSLEEISIPDSVTVIGNNAFDSCTSLRSIALPASIRSIAEYTFLNCASLRSVSIPNGVQSIGTWAFCFCTMLEEITLPDSLTSVGRNVFHGCQKLRSISLSKHHFPISELHNVLRRVQCIRCLAPIDEIPDEWKIKCCIGFAENEAAYSRKVKKGYLAHIRLHAAELYAAASKYPELLRLLCQEKLIDASHFDALLDETIRCENPELTALLLEYKRAHLAPAADASSDDLILD